MKEEKDDIKKQEATEEKNDNKSNKMKIFKNRKLKNILKHSIGFLIGATLSFCLAAWCSVTIQAENEEKLANQELLLVDGQRQVSELQEKVDKARPWFEMNEEEQRKIEEQNEKIESERLAAEKQKSEKDRIEKEKQAEQQKLAKEQEEKKGYDTGIGYKDLARNPKDYVGKKIKFEGKVIQVMEGDSETQLRLAVNGDYDNIILCAYNSSLVSSRILEDDYITVRGLSNDVVSYESTMGGNITIPSMLVKKIDMK